MIRPKHRRDMLELFPVGGIVAELGVFRGTFSERILEKLHPQKMYLVDTWSSPMDWWFEGGVQSVSGNEAYRETLRLERFPSVVIRRQSTIEFLSTLPDNSLDLSYHDADHSYESVRDELALVFPRMKRGGWIAGHDYCELFPGVMRAVDEFIALHGLQLDVLTDEVPGSVINCPGGPTSMAYNSFAFKVS